MSNEFFEIKDKEINVEEIMQHIRKNIEKNKMNNISINELTLIESEVTADCELLLDRDKFEETIRYNNLNWNISTEYPITSHRKTIGKFIILGKKIVRKLLTWYIKPPFTKQSEFNYSIVESLNQVRLFIYNSQNEVDILTKKLENIETSVRRLEKCLRKEKLINNTIANKSSIKDYEEDLNLDYFLFEQQYRGSRDEIMKRQSMYLKYFKDKEKILDIGCGRGEFIEILLRVGKKDVKGIDSNEDMIEFCKDSGLPVEFSDAVEYLEKTGDNTFDGIFMAQVLEHLEPSYILKLIDIAYKKLRKNGVIVIETINPQCLSVFANSFYMDLTHKKPIHPLTLEFILKMEGFMNTEICYSSDIEQKIPQMISSDIHNIEEINSAINRLNDLLYGAQDYAIIAKK